MSQSRELAAMASKPRQPAAVMEDSAPWASPDVREALDPFVPHEKPATQKPPPVRAGAS